MLIKTSINLIFKTVTGWLKIPICSPQKSSLDLHAFLQTLLLYREEMPNIKDVENVEEITYLGAKSAEMADQVKKSEEG